MPASAAFSDDSAADAPVLPRSPPESPLTGANQVPPRQFQPTPGDGVMQPPGPKPFGTFDAGAMPATHTPF